MSSTYSGIATALAALLPTAKTIASSTNTSPIIITTSAPHGCVTDDSIMVFDHLVNAAANGQWEVEVTSATTLKLIGSTGNGVGAATGSIHNQGFGSLITIPAVGDPRQIAGIAVAVEALADRTALLEQQLGWNLITHHGGVHQINNGGAIDMKSGSLLFCEPGSALYGSLAINGGTILDFLAASEVDFENLAELVMKFGSTETVHGTLELKSDATFTVACRLDVLGTGSIVAESSALIDIKGDGSLAGAGDLILRGAGNAKLQIEGNAELQVDALGLLDMNGTLDLSTGAIIVNGSTTATGTWTDSRDTTRDHPVHYSGNLAYIDERPRLDLGDASVSVHPEQYEVLFLTSLLSTDRIITLLAPPGNAIVRLLILVGENQLNGHNLLINDQAASGIVRFDPSNSHFGWAELRSRASGDWMVLGTGRHDFGGGSIAI